jgi:hypothetical protein
MVSDSDVVTRPSDLEDTDRGETDAEGDLLADDTDGTDGGRTADEVGAEAARTAWADAAREVLTDTARRYQAVVTHKELGHAVQERSGIRTKQLQHYWIGDVLRRVSEDCASRGEPDLSSLCVNSSGSVGDGYRTLVAATTGEEPADPDAHAARTRLACYRHFGADDLPGHGGNPALTPKLAATRTRARKAAHEARPVPLCPTCHLALTASGVCDNCD